MADDAKPEPVEAPEGKPMPEDNHVSRAEYDRLRREYDDAMEALTEALGESETLKARVAELEPFEKQAGDLQAKTRSLEAARMYDKVAAELKVKPEFKDDVFKLADLKLDGDPDEKAVRDHFSKFLADRKHYVAGGDEEPSKLPRGEGSSRASRDDGFGDGHSKERVSYAQLRDPEFTSKHATLLADPSKYDIVEA